MKLLITGSVQWTQEQLTEIASMGHSITYVQNECVPLKEQGIDPADIEGVVCNALFLHNELEMFRALRFIHLTSAGFDRVPLEEIQRRGIAIYNARGVYSIPMAEFAVTGVLMLYKQSRFFMENQKQHKWVKHRGLLELAGKKVGILGCGSIGTECAKRFNALGCVVNGVDLEPRVDEYFSGMSGLAEMNNVLHDSDIIVITLPLTNGTKHLMDKKRLSHMKHSSILVNIGRGAIVDTDALVEALQKKEIAGAVLDVFEEEPLAEESPLWDMENVILTPHNSFVGDRNGERLYQRLLCSLETCE